MAAVAQDLAGAVLRGLRDLPGRLSQAEPLARHTTFRIGGAATVMYWPTDSGALVEAARWAEESGVPWRVLGGGSNVLFLDRGFPGLVLSTRKLTRVELDRTELRAQAGVPLAALVRCGVGSLAGIPGTVGGAVVMNAGTRHGCLGQYLRWVRALDGRGRLRKLGPAECELGNRDSALRRLGWPVLSAGFRHGEGSVDPRRVLEERGVSQPGGLPSAGCVFRNPPDGPPAGWLIERAGLKGVRVGDAVVSEVHANFICNAGQARASDVLALIERVRCRVQQAFGIWLSLELDVINPL
ncbi:MAG: UDP-N-acetylmuramate dehydrogenase [Candidatus Bipolaricaulota bacterium]